MQAAGDAGSLQESMARRVQHRQRPVQEGKKIEVGAAERQIFVELHFLWFILFEMIASAS